MSENNFHITKKPFWIVKSLKRRGLIGGLYQIKSDTSIPYCNKVSEIKPPHLLKQEIDLNEAIYYNEDVKLDILELLKFSFSAYKINKNGEWFKTLPIYPTSPVEN